MNTSGFNCNNCKKFVPTNIQIGTQNRNHCPFCLYSLHIDTKVGDRKSLCHGNMAPIGLTFKKSGDGQLGELMLIHKCEKCGKISINRIAADDNADEIKKVYFIALQTSPESRQKLIQQGIQSLSYDDEKELMLQLYGKN